MGEKFRHVTGSLFPCSSKTAALLPSYSPGATFTSPNSSYLISEVLILNFCKISFPGDEKLIPTIITFLHLDYKYKKDEIFKRMKVSTLVQLVSKKEKAVTCKVLVSVIIQRSSSLFPSQKLCCTHSSFVNNSLLFYSWVNSIYVYLCLCSMSIFRSCRLEMGSKLQNITIHVDHSDYNYHVKRFTSHTVLLHPVPS